jgi:hypothetical protein
MPAHCPPGRLDAQEAALIGSKRSARGAEAGRHRVGLQAFTSDAG